MVAPRHAQGLWEACTTRGIAKFEAVSQPPSKPHRSEKEAFHPIKLTCILAGIWGQLRNMYPQVTGPCNACPRRCGGRMNSTADSETQHVTILHAYPKRPRRRFGKSPDGPSLSFSLCLSLSILLSLHICASRCFCGVFIFFRAVCSVHSFTDFEILQARDFSTVLLAF